MNNINYILYKKVFNNLYISNLIFHYVSQINNEILKTKFKNDSIEHIRKRNVFKINKIPLDVIVTKRLVYIFQDIVKSSQINYSFEFLSTTRQDTYMRLINFIREYNLINEFKQFYLSFKNQFLNTSKPQTLIDEDSVIDFYIPPSKDFFQILIESNNCPFEIIHFVYQDQKKFIDSEKEFYYTIKKDKSKDINLYINKFNYGNLNNQDSQPFKSPFSIYFNREMFKNVIETTCSFKLIDFLHTELEFDFDFYKSDILVWTFKENNQIKNEIINYTLNNFKVNVRDNLFDNNFISNMLALNYSTFKKMVKNGWSIRFNYLDELFQKTYKIIQDNSIYKFDYILILIHCFYFKTNNLELLVLIKFIQLLNKSDQINEQIINDNIKSIINKIFVKNKESWILSTFKRLSIYNRIRNLVNYNDFQIKREVKRVYLFGFLKYISNSDFSDNGYYYLIGLVHFSTFYKEYQLLYQDIDLYKEFNGDKKYLFQSLFELKEIVNYNIFVKKDYQLYKFFYNDIGIFNLSSESSRNHFNYKYLNSELYSIDQFEGSIRLLECLKDKNDPFFQQLFIVVLCSDFGSNLSNVDQIMDILKSYYLINNDKLSMYIDAYKFEVSMININTYLYIYNNYKHLFIKWEKCLKVIQQ